MAITWSPDGTWLVASSAAGEVVQYAVATGETTVLLGEQGGSVDALAMSADGHFLAAGGQAGTVWIWRLENQTATLIETLEHSRAWIDCLQWNPQHSELAFAYGRYVEVWDAADQSVVTTLNFDASSVLDLAWHPQGDRLSASGNQVIKTWQRQDWDEDPTVLETGIASSAIAWSSDGNYFAAGNNDHSVMMWVEGDPHPWRLGGFPGKVRQVVWSTVTASFDSPMLASMSGQRVAVSIRVAADPSAPSDSSDPSDPSTGWQSKALDAHQGTVSAIAFQPNTLLLASAAEDGRLCLWNQGSQLAQTLEHQSTEFSCLAWSPSGGAIAAGGRQGELLVWTKITPGKGFG